MRLRFLVVAAAVLLARGASAPGMDKDPMNLPGVREAAGRNIAALEGCTCRGSKTPTRVDKLAQVHCVRRAGAAPYVVVVVSVSGRCMHNARAGVGSHMLPEQNWHHALS